SREVASISKFATKGYLSVNAIEVFRQLDTIFFRRIDGGSLQDDQLTLQFTHLKHVFQQCSPMRRLPVCLNRLLKIAPKFRIAREDLDKRSHGLLVKLKVNRTKCIASGNHFTQDLHFNHLAEGREVPREPTREFTVICTHASTSRPAG